MNSEHSILSISALVLLKFSKYIPYDSGICIQSTVFPAMQTAETFVSSFLRTYTNPSPLRTRKDSMTKREEEKILNGLTYTCDGTGAIINKSYGGGSFEGRG